MRGVAGQEDGADPVVGDHPDVEAPCRAPAHGAQTHPGPAPVDDLPEGRVGRLAAGRGGGLELPARARRQRAEGDEVGHHAVRPAPLVPVVAVEALELDVGDQHAHLLARLAEERHAEQAPDRAAAAVGTDDEARAHGADGRGEARAVLGRGQVLDAHALLDGDPELGEPLAQHLLHPPLRDQQRGRPGRVARRRLVAARDVVEGPVAAVATDRQRRAPEGDEPVGDARGVEQLERARLQSLAPRPGERRGRRVEHPDGHAPARQLEGRGQPGRSRSHHDHVSVHGRDATPK